MLEFIISSIVIILIGCGLHFAYEFSHQNKIVALVASVNESTWEHMKLALSGVLIWSLYDGVVYGTSPNYFIAKAISIVILLILIPALFYGYQISAKKAILPLDIAIFCFAIFVSQFMFYIFLNLEPIGMTFTIISFAVLLLIFVFYALASYYPPKIWLFKDPTNQKYGLEAFTCMFRHDKKRGPEQNRQHKK